MIEHPPPVAERPAQLRDYLTVIRRRKWTVLAITLLFALGGLAFVLRQAPTYRSEAKIKVNPPTSENRSPDQLVDLDTEAEILHSPAVAERARRKMGSSLTPGQLLDHLDASPAGESTVLIVAYRDENPNVARAGAQAFAEAYVEFKVQDAREGRAARVKHLRRTINDLREQRLDEFEVCQEAEVGSLEKTAACRAAAELGDQIAVANQQLAETRTETVNPAQVFGQATQAFAPGRSRFILPIGAAFIGLVLGLALAFLREGMDDSLRGPTDLEQHLGAPVLGIVPKIKGWSDPKVPRLIMLEKPAGTAAESYRTLRTSLLYAASQRGLKSILVCSAFPGEGKTTTAVNLAVALAQAQKQVVLVSADLRKPRIHQFLKVRNEGGLASALAGEASLDDALVDPGIENLRFLPSGPMLSGQAELLGSEHMEKLLAELRGRGDFVVIDSPPLVVSDPLALAPLVDGVLYVADASSTNRGVVARAREQLEQVGAEMIGAVLNDFDPSKDREESYPASYGYTYGYQFAGRPAPVPAGKTR